MVLAIVGVLVLTVGGAAVASSGLLQEEPPTTVMSEEEVERRKADPGYVEVEEPADPVRVEESRERAERELQQVEESSPERLQERGESQQVELAEGLEAAIESLSPDLRAWLDSLTLAPSDPNGGLDRPYPGERALFTDGSGVLIVRWQHWPEDADPQLLVRPESRVVHRDGYDIAVNNWELADGSKRAGAGLFDGDILVAVEAWDLKEVEVDQVVALAEGIYATVADEARASG